MRNAPPVDAPLATGRAERAVILLLHGCAFAVAGAWLAGTDGSAALGWPAAVWSMVMASITGLVGLVLGWLAATRLLPPTPMRLRWTGQVWQLDDTQLAQVDLQLDAGRWLLLRCRPTQRGSRWAVARAGTVGAAWHGLRVALQAHAGSAVPAEVTPS